MTKKIIKKYLINNSYNSFNYIKKRCNKINLISKKLSFIPYTCFKIKKKEIIMKQNNVKSDKLNKSKRLKLLKEFALNLDKLSRHNLVHGDINFKNIIFNKKRIYLIDWEPILIKKIKKKFYFKFTFPYYLAEDVKNKIFTKKTDQIGFYFLCQRLFSGKLTQFNFSKIINDTWLEKYTKLSNNNFFKLKFIDIYNLTKHQFLIYDN